MLSTIPMISTVVTGRAASVTPHTEIDFSSLPEIEAAVAALPSTVIDLSLDLHEAPFMDVAGLHLLHNQRRAARQRSGKLVVTGLEGQPQRILKLAAELFPAMRWEDFLRDSHGR